MFSIVSLVDSPFVYTHFPHFITLKNFPKFPIPLFQWPIPKPFFHHSLFPNSHLHLETTSKSTAPLANLATFLTLNLSPNPSPSSLIYPCFTPIPIAPALMWWLSALAPLASASPSSLVASESRCVVWILPRFLLGLITTAFG